MGLPIYTIMYSGTSTSFGSFLITASSVALTDGSTNRGQIGLETVESTGSCAAHDFVRICSY